MAPPKSKPTRKGKAAEGRPRPDLDEGKTLEEMADAVDDTPAPACAWETVPECIAAIHRHVQHTHGLTNDKEMFERISAFLESLMYADEFEF